MDYRQWHDEHPSNSSGARQRYFWSGICRKWINHRYLVGTDEWRCSHELRSVDSRSDDMCREPRLESLGSFELHVHRFDQWHELHRHHRGEKRRWVKHWGNGERNTGSANTTRRAHWRDGYCRQWSSNDFLDCALKRRNISNHQLHRYRLARWPYLHRERSGDNLHDQWPD